VSTFYLLCVGYLAVALLTIDLPVRLAAFLRRRAQRLPGWLWPARLAAAALVVIATLNVGGVRFLAVYVVLFGIFVVNGLR
jgi:hypothetical protein